jgi:hypothetical protein
LRAANLISASLCEEVLIFSNSFSVIEEIAKGCLSSNKLLTFSNKLLVS